MPASGRRQLKSHVRCSHLLDLDLQVPLPRLVGAHFAHDVCAPGYDLHPEGVPLHSAVQLLHLQV